MNIHSGEVERVMRFSVRQTADWIPTPLFYHQRLVVSGSAPSPSHPPSTCLLKVLLWFSAGIVCGRWKCRYLTRIIGMSFLVAGVVETIPGPRNGNKPLAGPSDKGGTISHWMCVNIHWFVSARVCVCACTV